MTRIDFAIAPGEVHALLGENGAGKSTLVKILYGVIEPSAGEIFWEGKRVEINSPVDARNLGIGMVFQHFSLFGRDDSGGKCRPVALTDLSFNAVRQAPQAGGARATACRSTRIAGVWTLSAGERQRIEIVRCLLQNPKLIVLDEPTSVLTPQEIGRAVRGHWSNLPARAGRFCISRTKLEEVRRGCAATPRSCAAARSSPASIRARAAPARSPRLMVGQEVGDVARTAKARGHDEMLRGAEPVDARPLHPRAPLAQ